LFILSFWKEYCSAASERKMFKKLVQ